MATTLQPTELIRPFNLDPDEYEAMYNGPLPKSLTADLIITFYGDWEDLKHQTSELALCAIPDSLWAFFAGEREEEPLVDLLDSRACGLECDIGFALCHDMYPCAGSVWPSEKVFDWEIQRAQLQLVFLERFPQSHNLPINALTYAMRLFDQLWEQTGSVEASNHMPIDVSAEDAEQFKLIVGDVYRRRWGHMNRELVGYRNKALVAIHATIAGKDPIAEYDRFVKAGGKYYIEYPRLCR